MGLLSRLESAPGNAAGDSSSRSQSYDSSLLERLLFRVARKWIAGYNTEEAIAAALDSNRRGMSAILNLLGEHATDARTVESTVEEYLTLVNTMHKLKVKGCISAKPTQLGLETSYDICLRNFIKLAAKASAAGQLLWIDMESVKFAEDTFAIYLELLKEHGMVGVAIQSYLRRSASDLLHIIESGGKVRLVKGAYHESGEHAFLARNEVDANFSKLMKMLFEAQGRKNDFAVATHDSRLIEEAAALSSASGNSGFEFQMLMGIRDDLKSQLVSKGFAVAEYIPYGRRWLPYSVRRIRERKRNLLLLARSLVDRR